MRDFSSLPKPLLVALATLFATATLLYSAIWMYYIRWERQAFLGIDSNYLASKRALKIDRVVEGSGAERAGLRAGDLIVAVNRLPLETPNPFYDAVARGQRGDRVILAVERTGEAAPLELQATLSPRAGPEQPQPRAQTAVLQLLGSFPLLFVVVGLPVLFLRLEDRNAWLLALMFAGFVSGAPLLEIEPVIHPKLRGFALGYNVLFVVLGAAAFYYLLAVFPVRSPLDHRLPRLKWILLLVGAAIAVPLAAWASLAGSSQALFAIAERIGHGAVIVAASAYFLSTHGLGLVSLVWNGLRAPTAEARRKIRVIVWGTVAGFTPVFLLSFASLYARKRPYELPFWVWAPCVLPLFLIPLSFAYAVVKHRVLEIPMLLRLGLQYALARRLLLSLVPAVAAILLLDLLLRGNQPLVEILRARGWIYGALAGLALVAQGNRQRWLEALDRRFFRERYDAQRLLRDVVEEVREARSVERVAPRVVARIEAALHPEFAALLVREPREPTYRSLAAAPAGQAPPPLPADSKLASLVRLLGKPLDVSITGTTWLKQQLPHEETDFLRQARIEFLVPVANAPDRTEALLAVGPKRSEEPYTREDQDLLVTIASSLALLLEGPAAPPARMSDAFEECPQCGICYDTDAVRCAQEGATLNLVRVPRLLAERYRLERRLGRGGMGTVYAATDTALERRVAVKLIRDDLVGSADAAERFRREARAAAGFAHPNVVTVHDFGLAAGTRAFLVMELLDGTTLREELRRQRRLPAPRMMEILRGVSAAVDAAHRRQLIHRDLKPENIFLVRAEPGDMAKVLDFGIAKFLPSTIHPTTDTSTGFLVGTPYYMAPEQLRGEPVDPFWDLWALAVVAYEMLTGAQPFAGTTPAEWQSALRAGRFTPVATHLPDAPPRWQEFFEHALALESVRRPTSARLFFTELERAFA